MQIVINDYDSFLAGVQVGRRLKAWDAARSVPAPEPAEEEEEEADA